MSLLHSFKQSSFRSSFELSFAMVMNVMTLATRNFSLSLLLIATTTITSIFPAAMARVLFINKLSMSIIEFFNGTPSYCSRHYFSSTANGSDIRFFCFPSVFAATLEHFETLESKKTAEINFTSCRLCSDCEVV
jgi:hypothetical protein